MNEDLYQMYREEIELIEACTAEENAVLLGKLAVGEQKAKQRLVEGNLKLALAFVKDYQGSGVALNDLVQEANMALVMAVDSYGALAAAVAAERPDAVGAAVPGALERYLEEKIKAALQAALEAVTLEGRAEEELVARVNVLKDISGRLANELGREATVEELAETMKMSVDEIKDIIKLTLDAMSVPEE